ncbi:MAG: peptidase [Bacteroidetes bacterium]|nr:peptidase [Bacteroidota bacterium]
MQKIFTLTLIMVWMFGPAVGQPAPKDHFGFQIGDDYHLANYTQTAEYFKKLTQSNRVKLVSIGETEEGRDHPMLIITSPENHRKLDRLRDISLKLARAEGIDEVQAKALAAEGKAVVWIDGGLHATETVGIHQLIETAYQLATRNDPETVNILDQVVILMVHANPDGQELVSNWYMREPKPEKRKLDHLPRLYQKYIGHDNNRDFFMLNMKETQNMARQLFVDWIPQIMYNHHQAGPAGSVVAGPPYRDPFNYVFDPLTMTGLDAIGASMISRLNLEGKPGYTRLDGSVFSTWYNGGLRTTTYFHNMLGLLTEIIGNPTPMEVPLVPSRLIPNNDTPFPVTPQKWFFRQSIDYSVSLNYGVLDYAARHRDQLLFNIWKMGKNSIERGSGDHWTPFPSKIEAIQTAFKSKAKPQESNPAGAGYGATSNIPVKLYDSIFKTPANRDPRAYVVTADQQDFSTAIRFINALIRTGIRVHKATAPFSVGNKNYPTGSFIVKTDQPFRPHVLDMFDAQDHPNDFQYPGGPPVRPYDAAGWTLSFQMGIEFDRYYEPVNAAAEAIPYGELQPLRGKISGSGSGYVMSSQSNASFTAVNDLLDAGITVYRINGSPKTGIPAGSFYVAASSKSKAVLQRNAELHGLHAQGISKTPASIVKVQKPRIALLDVYGGSMPSGWIRWLMEQYHFKANVVYPKEIEKGGLKEKYDALILVTGMVPSVRKETENNPYARRDPKAEEIPAEWHNNLGSITAEKSVPELRKFIEAGGRIVTIGTSANLAYQLGLPVKNALTEIGPNGTERNLPGEKYYVPGSILQVRVDSTQQSTWGMKSKTDVYFENSPVFKVSPEAIAQGRIKPLAWFADDTMPLRSGWAWGQNYLKGGVVAFEASVGKGKLLTFGPEITFRGQAHGTFRMLFNQLIETGPNQKLTLK